MFCHESINYVGDFGFGFVYTTTPRSDALFVLRGVHGYGSGRHRGSVRTAEEEEEQMKSRDEHMFTDSDIKNYVY
jgi:hypothetical protein